METIDYTNPEVEITSLYFRQKDEDQRLEGYPRRMIYDGREYNFLDSSMRFLVRTGQKLIKLFDVSDGSTSFRLRLEDEHWTLVSMKANA